jgi:hypothetical protein
MPGAWPGGPAKSTVELLVTLGALERVLRKKKVMYLSKFVLGGL